MSLINPNFILNISGKKSNREKIAQNNSIQKDVFSSIMLAILQNPAVLKKSLSGIALKVGASKPSVHVYIKRLIEENILERVSRTELRVLDLSLLRKKLIKHHELEPINFDEWLDSKLDQEDHNSNE